MPQKKNSAANLATLANNDVPYVMSVLNEKIASLKHIEEAVYRPSVPNLSGFGDISKEMKIETLIRAYHSVRAREDGYHSAAAELGIKTYPAFSIDGGSPDDWKHNILLRKSVIEYKDTLDKLNEYKDRMSKFLSENDQKNILLKDMSDFFKSL